MTMDYTVGKVEQLTTKPCYDEVANGLAGANVWDYESTNHPLTWNLVDTKREGFVLTKPNKPQQPKGLKFDGDKLKWSLVPWLAMKEVVKVLMRGEAKYTQTLADGTVISGADNWKLVEDWNRRYFDSSMRHNIDEWLGKDFDDESGIWELAHNICGDLFRLQMKLEEKAKEKV